jgi:tRNA(adenine34) deaminase
MRDMSRESCHEKWMRLALEQADAASAQGDVPIGAVIVRQNELVARAYNRRIIDANPVAHAEMLAIQAAAKSLGDWRLTGCTLYVTLEPCCMCAGAIVLSRIPRLIYGAGDAKAGAVDTLYQLCSDSRLNHQVEVSSGLLAEECSQRLTRFFAAQRALGKK